MQLENDIPQAEPKREYEIILPITWRRKPSILNRILSKKTSIASEERFIIRPCLVCNMYRIANAAQRLPAEILFKDSLEEAMSPLVEEHLKTIVYIVAAGIQNNHLEPDPELIETLTRNASADQLIEYLNIVMVQFNMQSFYNCLVLIKGTSSILKPKDAPKLTDTENQ